MKKSITIIFTIIITMLINSNIYAKEEYKLIKKWGMEGTEKGNFRLPWGITLDNQGNVYVTDHKNNRIQKFDSSGNFITKWGSKGFFEDGQFNGPMGITADMSGNIYVPNIYTPRIQKFNSKGVFITKWGQEGEGKGEFDKPWGVAVDGYGNVYVSEFGNHRIQKFDSLGKFITRWGTFGTGQGQFDNPGGIAIDSNNNIYIADLGNDRIQKFNARGELITKWGYTGYEDGKFSSPWGIAVDSSGYVYVTDQKNNRVQKFDSLGKFITRWGSKGKWDRQFNSPKGIAVDSSGNVYIADSLNNRIQKFAIAKEDVPLSINTIPDQFGYWNFNDGTAKDITGGNNGIIYNATKTAGKVGNGLKFNGINSYVEIPFSTPINMNNQGITVNLWAKREGNTTNKVQRILKIGEQFTFGLNQESNKFGGFVYIDQWKGAWGESDYVLEDNVWYNLSMSFNGKEKIYFINGKSVKKVDLSGNINGTQGGMRIGMWISYVPEYNYPFKGIIDEVRVFSRALSAKEIEVLWKGK